MPWRLVVKNGSKTRSRISSGIPGPLIVDLDGTGLVAHAQDAHVEPPFAAHRLSGVHEQVREHEPQLIRICVDRDLVFPIDPDVHPVHRRILSKAVDEIGQERPHASVVGLNSRGRANASRSSITVFSESMRATISVLSVTASDPGGSVGRDQLHAIANPRQGISHFVRHDCRHLTQLRSAACSRSRCSWRLRCVMSYRIAMYCHGLPRASRNGTIVVSTQ